MENKSIILSILVLLAVLSFLGASITGFMVYKVDYEDLCTSDADCPENQCCLMYEGLGLCMDNCQSINFLCKEDHECEEGTVCCISEGMEYGICNLEDNCKSIDMYREYIEKRPVIEEPSPIVLKNTSMIFTALFIVLLIGIIIWLYRQKPKKKK